MSSSSGRYSLFSCLQHLVGKEVYLVERRVNVGGDSNSSELGVHDRRVHDPVLAQEPGTELDVVDPLDLEESDCARLPVVERGEHRHARALRHDSLCPPVTQVAEPRDLSVLADSAVKRHGGGNRVVVGSWMSADLLVLPDVVVLSRSRGHERPEILLLVLPHVQESSAHRREQPLVKTRSVIVALEIVALERKVCERVRAIHEHFDSCLLYTSPS